MQRTYIAIDLKSYYASVECMERGLDPMTTNLVVADLSRTEKTICLAVSPSLKAYGIPGRARLFEVVERVKEVNAERQRKAGGNLFEKSCDARELAADPLRAVGYLVAPPQMAKYIQISTQIYNVYLKYIAPEDIHVYSIDEVMMDVTSYLETYNMTARELAKAMILDVLRTTGITATAGIGPNLLMAKVALDVCAKHAPDGIGVLDDDSWKREIWFHRPITDIWGIGPGVAARLEKYGVYDLMGVAALDENLLYDELGVNAEYLIDHAFGREPTTIADIQAYRPQATSTTTGQVLSKGYAYEQAYTVLREMVDNAVLDLIDKHVVCDSISLFVGYASELADIRRLDASGTAQYVDGCGHLRSSTSSIEPTATAGPELAPRAPKPVQRDDERRRLVREAQAIDGIFVGEHGGKPRGGYAALFAHSNASRKLPERTNSFKKIMGYFDELWAQTVDPKRPVKRINLGFSNLVPEEFATIDLFSDIEADERERDLARAVLAVKGKYGKNALVKGLSFTAGATARERNEQVGGHRA